MSGVAPRQPPANREQGLNFRTHNHAWVPTDFDGLDLVMRPQRGTTSVTDAETSPGANHANPPSGWSQVAQRRRFRSDIERRARGGK